MKKITAVFLALTLTAAIAPVTFAAEVFDVRNGVLEQYNGSGGSIVIPDNVTEIKTGVFNGKGITNVTIGTGLREIGDFAFYNCPGLKYAVIPETVTKIGLYAFGFGVTVTDFRIYGAVGSAGNKYAAANGLPFISEFDISGGVITKYNGPGGSVIIPYGIERIGDKAFFDNVYYPSDSNNLMPRISSVTFPGSLTEIGEKAFNTPLMTSVTVPESVTKIGNNALGFYEENGAAKKVPNFTIYHYSSGAAGAYATANNFAHIQLGDNQTALPSPDPNKDFVIQGTFLAAYNGKSGDVTIPSYVTAIGASAFYGNAGLTRVVIPEGVTEIGDWAFFDTPGLMSVELPRSIKSIGEYALGYRYDVTKRNQIRVTDFVIYGYTGGAADTYAANNVIRFVSRGHVWDTGASPDMKVTNGVLTAYTGPGGAVTIPSNVTEIGDWAFYNKKITSAAIHSGVKKIGKNAFGQNPGLAYITIPEGVTSIGEAAFAGCSALYGVSIPLTVTSIGKEAFFGCTALKGVTIPNDGASIGERAFAITREGGLADPNFTLRGGSASGARRYAAAYGIKFESTDLPVYTVTARPVSAPVYVDNKLTSFDAYEMGGNHYLKLRDVAYMLSGTDSQFEVEYDIQHNAVYMETGRRYTPVGGEMSAKSRYTAPAVTSGQPLYIDGARAWLAAYVIGGNNYVKLRDIARVMNTFDVDWRNGAVWIVSGKGYTPN